VTKAAQNLLLLALGAAVLWITLVTGEYVNYVKPGFRFMLVPAAAAMIVLGAAGLRREWRDTGDTGDAHREPAEHGHEGHEHGKGPRVAWLLCLPALAVFVIAPPALGSFTASRNAARAAAPPAAPDEGYGRLSPAGGPIKMTMGEFIGRSFETQSGYDNGLPGVQVQLTGFVSPSKGGDGWNLTRLKITCCAGDAIPFRVLVHGTPAPKADSWVQVVGTWAPPTSGKAVTGVHELRAQSVRQITKPKNPYE
jgi:uncharacterized repeat protein (TIGR03943 family)